MPAEDEDFRGHQVHRRPPRLERRRLVRHEMLEMEEGPGGVVHHHTRHQVGPIRCEQGKPGGPGFEREVSLKAEVLILAEPLLVGAH